MANVTANVSVTPLSARGRNVLRTLRTEADRKRGGLVPVTVIQAQDGRVIRGLRNAGALKRQGNGYKVAF